MGSSNRLKMVLQSNKKGQFYIFIAILLIAYAFTILKTDPLVQNERDEFKELHQNFISEGRIVVNNALYERNSVFSEFNAYADSFEQYSKTKAPRFKFAYIVKDGDKMVIGNKFGFSINATVQDTAYSITDTLTLSASDISLIIDGITYDFDIGLASYDIKAVFMQKTDTELRIVVEK